MVDVGRLAGVSLKTVSRVVNGEPGVSVATVKKVLAAAAELRYERNDLAASLRHGDRSNTLGLVIEDVGNPFYSVIAQAVEESARERQSLLITASAREDPVRERELVIALLRRRVDALLIVPAALTTATCRTPDCTGAPCSSTGRRPAPRPTRSSSTTPPAPGAACSTCSPTATGGSRSWVTAGACTPPGALKAIAAPCPGAGVEADPDLVALDNSTWQAATDAVTRLLAQPSARCPTALRCQQTAVPWVRCSRSGPPSPQPGARRLRRLRAGRPPGGLGGAHRSLPIGPARRRAGFALMDGDARRPARVVVLVEARAPRQRRAVSRRSRAATPRNPVCRGSGRPPPPITCPGFSGQESSMRLLVAKARAP